MQIYYVTVETRATSRVTVAARSEAEARADALLIAGAGARCLDAVPASYTAEAQAHEALAHLLVQDWLPLNDQPATVLDWVERAVFGPDRAAINAKLALAGLRVLDNLDLTVGTAVPVLRRWFASTPWGGAGLRTALSRLPGARLEGPRYFQGVQSKTVRLPYDLLRPHLPADAGDEVAA